MPVTFLQTPPGLHLRPWVHSLWYCRAGGSSCHRERVLPNGNIQIIISLSRDFLTDCGEDGAANLRLPKSIIVGARARYGVVDTSDMEELAGVVIRPGGFAGLFQERADLLFEQSVALEQVWACPGLAERLRERPTPAEKLRTLEALLTGVLREGARRSVLVDEAMHLFRKDGLNVAECARSVGVSERRLSQVFREHVGIAPKMWCRIGRFQAAVQALHGAIELPWAELALACGYCDQSHFSNDFRAFSGIDPSTYSANRGPWQNHAPIA